MDTELSEWIMSCHIGFRVVRVDFELSEWNLSCPGGF